jgi:hypothetical protein
MNMKKKKKIPKTKTKNIIFSYKLTSQPSSQITDTTPNTIIPVSTTTTNTTSSSTNSSSINNDCLSESTIEKMRRQVIYQREKVEEER